MRKQILFLFCLFVFANTAMGQTWNIGHNSVPGGNYLSTVTATLSGNTLTIRGNGNMADFWNTGTNQYNAGGEAPWWFPENDYRRHTITNAIHTVVFQNGSTVTNIGNRAFKDLSRLREITIPNSVTIIGRQAFFNCINLSEIKIPNSVTEIEGEAFLNCSSLRTVRIEDGTTQLNFTSFIYRGDGFVSLNHDWFKSCPIQTLYLGRDYTYPLTLGAPFREISTLQTLTIGDTVTSIGGRTFYGCIGLVSVTIGSNVTQIGQEAFYGCIGLTTITSKNPTPPTAGVYCFTNVGKNIPVKVPCNSICAYKSAVYWRNFTNYQSIERSCNSSCLSSINEISANQLQIFPNPVKDELFIKSEFQIEKVEIYDLSGRAVETLRAPFLQQNGAIINVSALPQGIYLLKVYTDEGLAIRKVVKE